MADNVSDILAPEVLPELRELSVLLKEAATNVTNLGNAAKGITIEFKGVKDFATLNDLIAKNEAAIGKLSTATDTYAKTTVDAAAKREAAEKKAFDAYLKREYEREQAGKRALDAITREREKAAEREAKATAKLNNAYEQLKLQYKQAADEAKRLGAEFGVTDSRATKAAASSMKLYNSLLAVEKSVGQAQRQVGQYNQAAFAMSQVLREMPNFALGARVGILALSNNIPMLVDEIKNLQTANAALTASGGKAIPIWKTLMSSITSPVGLVTIATTALTFLAVQTDIFKSKTKEATDAVNKFDASMKSLNETLSNLETNINVGITNEAGNAKLLFDVYNDANTTLAGRVASYKQLQGMFPNVLTGLSDEEKATGQLTEAHRKQINTLNEVIKAKVHLDEIGKSVTIAGGTQEDIKKQMRMQEAALSDASKRAVQRAIKAQGDRATHPLVNDPAAGVDEDAVNKFLDLRDKQMHIEKQIAALKAIQYKYTVQYMNAQIEADAKIKMPADKTLKSENDLADARYDNQMKDLEINRDTNKAISEDVTKELGDRLVAYHEYQSAVIGISELIRDKEIEIQNNKMKDIEAKMKTATGQALTNLQDQYKAAEIRIDTANKEFNNSLKKTTADGQKQIIEIVASANDEWVKDESLKYQMLKELQIGALIVEENQLKEAYKNKEITRKEYNKRLAELQHQQNILFIKAEIEFDKKILSNEQITAEKRLEYQKKLNADEKALANADKGVKSTRKTGRITDSVALLFSPSDLENEEQYLQEFYDRTVQMAQTAADAIAQAKMRQFEVEKNTLDQQAAAVDKNYQNQIALINATTKNDVDRANKLNQLAAQKQSQDETINQKKKEVAQRQAAAEKTAAISAIIMSTAVAIAGALKYGPAAPAVIALVAATGAVQLAAAANAPVPAYKHGTLNHPGGDFIAGDGGAKELIVEPGKAPYWSNAFSTMYTGKAGTAVIPEDIVKYASPTSTADFRSAIPAIDYTKLAKAVGKEFDKTGQGLASVIYAARAKPTDMGAIADRMRMERNLQGK